MQADIRIGNTQIAAGSQCTVSLALPKLNSNTELSMPVHVIHGRRSGPRLFVSAAIHGDELNGIEICQRLLEHKSLGSIRGTLLVVPVVNVYGLIHRSRYLPDRRDLNRSFPGSETGSLTARVAYLFQSEIVARCSHGIDLHTGAVLRSNLPQIRANLDNAETAALARAFAVPVVLNSALRDGSLRDLAAQQDIPVLLYEAGEALRYDEISIRAGVHGILNVMRHLHMLGPGRRKRPTLEPFVARTSSWIRAPESGMLRYAVRLGQRVSKGDRLGVISDPYTSYAVEIHSPYRGIVIGASQSPLAYEGEALFHIARFNDALDEVVEGLDSFQLSHSDGETESEL